MTKKYTPCILILGATGMLGRITYQYIKTHYPDTTWGTARTKNKSGFLLFHAEHAEAHIQKICKLIKHVDYVINCTGILKGSKSVKDMVYVNALFPHILSELAEHYRFHLIHVSTDAVFSPYSGRVNEYDATSPIDLYGMSKLLGEPLSKHVITIRTSLIGSDPIKQKGFIEWIRNSTVATGFDDQLWTGCTTLQFARFSRAVIQHNLFESLRKVSPIFHFSPINPLTKYELAKTIIDLYATKTKLKKSNGGEITRVLDSVYKNVLLLDDYNHNIKDSLQELISFENSIENNHG